MHIIQTPSPNFDERTNSDGSTQSVDILMMHYTGMQTGEAALERMCDAEAKVSAHYMVEEDGRVFQLVDEEKRAWHAGVASWRGNTNINARSIGIEIVNPGHEWGYREFPEAQIASVMALSKEILSRHDIPARNVIGHSDVAPMRKQDPGELFPWQRLAGEGIGLWSDRVQSSEFRVQGKVPLGSEPRSVDRAFSARERLGSSSVTAVQLGSEQKKQLQTYGYGISEESSEEEIVSTITAFQRHFRPTKVDGIWDAECNAVLSALLT